MSPILGIIASQNYPRSTLSFDSIATAVGTGSSATLSFTSIPSTYKHLQIRYISRSTAGSSGLSGIQVIVNSDTTAANYSFHRLVGDGTSASSYGTGSSLDYILINSNSANTSGMYAVGVVDILDYANINKTKTIRTLNGSDLNNTLGAISLKSQGWFSTNAITRLDFTTSIGNFDTNSSFALYGVKG